MSDRISDPWKRKEPFTQEQVQSEIEKFWTFMYKDGETPTKYCTCGSCVDMPYCRLAFDVYNTDGDCLYDK